MADAIEAHKRSFGSRLVILGHHYQQDEVIRFADFTGDSLKLAQIGAEQKDAEYIVFCGVHFMAESADILTDDRVTVILPDLSAGCSMADMADPRRPRRGVGVSDRRVRRESDPDHLRQLIRLDQGVLRITQRRLLHEQQRAHGARVGVRAGRRQEGDLFARPAPRPQHCLRAWAYRSKPDGRSTIRRSPTADSRAERGGRGAKVILWKGHCSVHGLFTTDAGALRSAVPIRIARIIVHPECTLGGRPAGGPGGQHRVHPQDRAGGACGIALGHRNGDPSRQPASPGAPGQGGAVARGHPMSVHHDVPDRPETPTLDARRVGHGACRESNHCRSGDA